jgi:hypothetical protein
MLDIRRDWSEYNYSIIAEISLQHIETNTADHAKKVAQNRYIRASPIHTCAFKKG